MNVATFPALLIFFLPLATVAASSLLAYSPAVGWAHAPAPAATLTSHAFAHLPSTTIAILNFERVRVVVSRLDAVGDAASFKIVALTCGTSGDDVSECTGTVTAHELSAPSASAPAASAPSDLEPLLLAVASSASPYGCSHVVNPSITSTSTIPDGSGGSVTLTVLRASILTGQSLQRASFALARAGAASSPWKLLTHDFVAVAPDPLRLPVNALPIKYDILLSPNPLAKNYSGQVSMTARIMCSTSQLQLNSVGLALSVLSLSVNGSPRPLPSLTLQPDQQLVTAAAASPFQPGDIVILTLSFSGALSQVNTGLYIASAKAPPFYVIASHFEPTDARRAWPCMDEPAFKAVFNISVIKPEDAPIVLSNLPLSSRSGPSARELWSFAPAGAVAMSSYLVTIVIGNFSCTTATLPPPSPGVLPPGVQTPVIRVYTVPGAQSQAAVALHTARASIDRMAALLVSSFPLPKLDLVAIPDYPSGATEHWGLITFRETTLLLDAAASARDIERVATVVAHEVAHSWFGNLVTMPWWTELWLNEGFASFWEYEGVQAAYAGWGLWDVMPVADTQRAMSIDLLASALPLIQASVRSDNEMHAAFSATTYSKGAAAARTWSLALGGRPSNPVQGNSSFLRGTAAYLAKFAFGIASTEDLVDCLCEAAGSDYAPPPAPVAADCRGDLMRWASLAGVPLLSIAPHPNSPAPVGVVTRFTADGQGQGTWRLPLQAANGAVMQVGGGGAFAISSMVPVFDPASSAPLATANPGCSGYWRTSYSERGWETLVTKLPLLPLQDIVCMVDDAFALANTNFAPPSLPLRIAAAVASRANYPVWVTVIGHLRAWSRLLATAPPPNAIHAFAARVMPQLTWPPHLSGAPEPSSSIARPCIDGVPFAPPSFTLDCPPTHCCHATNRLQAAILLFAVEQGVAAAVSGGADLFARAYALSPYSGIAAQGSGIIPADVRSAALQAGVMSFGRPAFAAVLAEYKIIPSAAEKARLLAAAASATDLVLLRELLQASLDVSVVRVQDTISTISAVAANPTTGAIGAAWSFVKQNWPVLVLRYKGINFAMDNLLSSFKAFSQASDVEDLRIFIAKNSADLDSAVAAQTLESASSNAAWVEAHAQAVNDWVYPPPPAPVPSPPDAGRNGAQSSAEAIALVAAVCAAIALTTLAFKMKRRSTYARQNDV